MPMPICFTGKFANPTKSAVKFRKKDLNAPSTFKPSSPIDACVKNQEIKRDFFIKTNSARCTSRIDRLFGLQQRLGKMFVEPLNERSHHERRYHRANSNIRAAREADNHAE